MDIYCEEHKKPYCAKCGPKPCHKTESIYNQKGYTSREDYLHSLAHEYEVDLTSVLALANLLGPNEDFDGLVSELEDFSQFM